MPLFAFLPPKIPTRWLRGSEGSGRVQGGRSSSPDRGGRSFLGSVSAERKCTQSNHRVTCPPCILQGVPASRCTGQGCFCSGFFSASFPFLIHPGEIPVARAPQVKDALLSRSAIEAPDTCSRQDRAAAHMPTNLLEPLKTEHAAGNTATQRLAGTALWNPEAPGLLNAAQLCVGQTALLGKGAPGPSLPLAARRPHHGSRAARKHSTAWNSARQRIPHPALTPHTESPLPA